MGIEFIIKLVRQKKCLWWWSSTGPSLPWVLVLPVAGLWLWEWFWSHLSLGTGSAACQVVSLLPGVPPCRRGPALSRADALWPAGPLLQSSSWLASCVVCCARVPHYRGPLLCVLGAALTGSLLLQTHSYTRTHTFRCTPLSSTHKLYL